MPTTLTIPKLEMAMIEGTLAEWLVPDGAAVKEGDLIYSLETGKATQEIEAPGRRNADPESRRRPALRSRHRNRRNRLGQETALA